MTDPRPHTRARQLLLAGLFFAVLGLDVWWVARTDHPFGQETCNHLSIAQRTAIDLDRSTARGDLRGWASRRRREGNRATAVHMLLAPIYRADPDRGLAHMTLALGAASLLVLAIAVHVLSVRLGADTETAAVAVAAVLLVPGVWGPARHLALDLPLASTITAFAALLVSRPPWDRLPWAGGLGLAAGMTLLVKGQAALWLPGLLLPSLWLARQEGLAWSRIARAGTALGAGALVGSAPYWFGGIGELYDVLMSHLLTADNPAGSHEQWTWPGLSYYPRMTWGWLGPPLWLLLCAGWITIIRRGPRRQLVLWGWVAGGLVTFTLFRHKWERFALPALPALVVLGSVGASAWRPKLRRAACLGALGLAALICLLASTRPAPPLLGLPTYCAPPATSDWDERMRSLAAAVRSVAPAHRAWRIGIEGPERLEPDDYVRLGVFARRAFGGASVRNRIPQFARHSPGVLEAYDKRRPRMDLILVVYPEGQPPASLIIHRAGRLRIDGGTLHPSPGGRPPLRLTALLHPSAVRR